MVLESEGISNFLLSQVDALFFLFRGAGEK